jgi:hypothetical protein
MLFVGRMLLVLLTYALYPQVRSALWMKKHRELSLLKFVSHFQALADSWMKMIFKSLEVAQKSQQTPESIKIQ